MFQLANLLLTEFGTRRPVYRRGVRRDHPPPGAPRRSVWFNIFCEWHPFDACVRCVVNPSTSKENIVLAFFWGWITIYVQAMKNRLCRTHTPHTDPQSLFFFQPDNFPLLHRYTANESPKYNKYPYLDRKGRTGAKQVSKDTEGQENALR